MANMHGHSRYVIDTAYTPIKNAFALDTTCFEQIDYKLATFNLFRLQHFHFLPGDCLFDSLAVLVHFRYSSQEIRQGIINHFRNCLASGDALAISSLDTELNLDFLNSLHHVNDFETYLELMSVSASPCNESVVTGLWGDIFCIKWFSKWLSVPVSVWSLLRTKQYLSFQVETNKDGVHLLFHDHNPSCGHFEPLLQYRSTYIAPSLSTSIVPCICPDNLQAMDIDMQSIHVALSKQCLKLSTVIQGDCHDSLFESICSFAPWFDVVSLRKTMGQTFYNCFVANDAKAIACLNLYLSNDLIQKKPSVSNWQGLIYNMSMLYSKGNVEGNDFALQWLCEMLNVNISIWNAKTKKVTLKFYSSCSSTTMLYLICFQLSNSHCHFQPLFQISPNNNVCTTILDKKNKIKTFKRTSQSSLFSVVKRRRHMKKQTPREQAMQFLAFKKIVQSPNNTSTNKKSKTLSRVEALIPFKKGKRKRSSSATEEDVHILQSIQPSSPVLLHTFPFSSTKPSKRLRHLKQDIRNQGLIRSEEKKLHDKAMQAVETYLESIKDTPTYACVVCERLHFQKDMHIVDTSVIATLLSLASGQQTPIIKSNDNICKYCNTSIRNEKIPPLASPICIRRNTKVESVSTLTHLEERLISPRLAFAQIRQLGYKKSQLGLTGSVINVPSNLDIIQLALPRSVFDTMTIAVMIKRKMEYKHAFLSGNVRPKHLMVALKDLCNTPLYKSEGIVINTEWEQIFNNLCQKNNNEFPDTENIHSSDDENDVEPISETLVHGYGEAQLINDLDTQIIQIAPSEGFKPLGIFQDKFSEELNFPTLFYGSSRPADVTNRFSYQKIANWELLHSSEDFSTHITNIFYKAVKVLVKQVSSSAWISVRRGELKGKKITAKDVKYQRNLENILKSPIAYRSLQSIRTSPDYFETIRKDVFAMIRQLGPPTSFVTFTSAEHLWSPLISALQNRDGNTTISDENTSLDESVDAMLRNHPVICSRYYRHRMLAMRTLILKNSQLFGEVQDYFFITEFQSRGNEHDHALLWIKNAPIYGQSSEISITSFIDKYLSSDSSLLTENLIKVQTHHHTKTCRKNKHSNCRFNFPFPPMDKTTILHPYEDGTSNNHQKQKELHLLLHHKIYSKDISFETFLQDLQLTNHEYIDLIRSSLTRPVLLLKRNPCDVWINAFAKQVPQLWHANTDAQFILNAHAAATYCSSYMTKMDRSMTTAFKKIREDCSYNKDSKVETIRRLGNALLNMQQMSSRQAVHIVLSLPLYSSSRKTVFINTAPIEKRACVLKKPHVLQQEPDDSENIMCDSIIDKYLARPPHLDQTCLAEYVSYYTCSQSKTRKRKRPCIIRSIRYNEHRDPENHFREKLMLFFPYRESENLLKKNYQTWYEAYLSHKLHVDTIEKKFLPPPTIAWGDIHTASEKLTSKDEQMFMFNDLSVQECTLPVHDKYDIQHDLLYSIQSRKHFDSFKNPVETIQHPFVLDTPTYYAIRKKLNQEQQSIVKEIILRKKNNPSVPIHVFLTGNAGTGKTFTAKAIFHGLLRIYNKDIHSDPLKKKGLIVAFTGKAAYNADGVTVHSAFRLPLSQSNILPLASNTLDQMSKEYEQLRLLFVDESSLIGSRMLYNMDIRLRQIMHTPIASFGNVDLLFCGDLFQAQPVHDSWIFEPPRFRTEKIPYRFWKDNVKCFELKQVMRQDDKIFVGILNRIRTCSQTNSDISYLNKHCYRTAPDDPTFPYLFHRNIHVQQHNKKMLSLVKSDAFTINSFDRSTHLVETNNYSTKKMCLPTTVVLKQNMLVELIGGNYAINDGLVNGADGIFRLYTSGTPDIIWIEFTDTTIGSNQRQTMHQLYKTGIESKWTPITRICAQVVTKNGCHLIRQQFPVQLACARTIHRSQGLTMDRLAFDPQGVKQHGLVYTALSRVKDIKSLYLVNQLQPTNFSVSQKVVCEMDRLRTESSFQFHYAMHSKPGNNSLLISCLNTRSLPLHIEHIANDADLMNADILCLQETKTNIHQENVLLSTKYNYLSIFHLHGIFTYYNKNIVLEKTYNYIAKHIESIVASFKIRTLSLKIANVYIAPNAPLKDVFDFVASILKNAHPKEHILLAGDFNIDMSSNASDRQKFMSFMNNNNFTLHMKATTCNTGSVLDHFWSNLDNQDIQFAISEAYWTDHDAISLSIPLQ